MKYLFRLIGFLVVVVILAALALYTLNSFGYLHGELSKYINSISNHCQGTVNDTIDFIENQEYIDLPIRLATPEPTSGAAVPTFRAP